MLRTEQIVAFEIDGQHFGIPLKEVERVVRIVEITHLPTAPDYIRGVINVQGEIMPVLDLRRRFNLPERTPLLSDQLIIIRCSVHSFALVAESACEVIDCTIQTRQAPAESYPKLPFLAGVAKLEDGLILLSNPDDLLTPSDKQAIDELLGRELP